MNCREVDELAAAYALEALPPEEEHEVSEHLADCDRPHEEARSLIEAASLLPASLPPVPPSPALRARLMATVAATPQEHRTPTEPSRVALEPRREPRRSWWQVGPIPSAIGAVGVVALLALGGWSLNLNQQLAERDAAIRAVASADSVIQVAGSAGSGLLLEVDGEATFLAEGLADLPAGSLYELWLIGPDGAPVAVGTLSETDGVALVPLDRPIGPATTFAVTVEAERVEAPTSEPVLVGTLEG